MSEQAPTTETPAPPHYEVPSYFRDNGTFGGVPCWAEVDVITAELHRSLQCKGRITIPEEFFERCNLSFHHFDVKELVVRLDDDELLIVPRACISEKGNPFLSIGFDPLFMAPRALARFRVFYFESIGTLSEGHWYVERATFPDNHKGQPQMIRSHHFTDSNGNPAGGTTFGNGFAIGWQNGPLGRGEERQEPNGAFVEDIIKAAIDRIGYYQSSRFACERNAEALEHLTKAVAALNSRTAEREARNVEGTHAE